MRFCRLKICVFKNLLSFSVLIIFITDEVSGQACDSVLSVRGIIVSEGYPEAYPNLYDCTWIIDATDTQTVTIVFEDFAVEPGETCEFDSLEVRDAAGSRKLCGDRVEKLGGRMSVQGKTILRLTSDDSVQERGFKLRFQVSEDESAVTTTTVAPATTPPPGVTCDDEPCQNDGFCEMVDGDVICLCEDGFEGDYCQISEF
ncbi:protein SpAN-like [Ciona intestinalis]